MCRRTTALAWRWPSPSNRTPRGTRTRRAPSRRPSSFLRRWRQRRGPRVRLVAQRARLVVNVAFRGCRSVLLVGRYMALVVVRVLVADAVTEAAHEAGRRVAQVQRHGLVTRRPYVGHCAL